MISETNNKSRYRRVLLAGGLVAGVALIAAGGFSASVESLDMGAFSTKSWDKKDTPDVLPDGLTVAVTPGVFKDLAPGVWNESGKQGVLDFTNSTDKAYTIDLAGARKQWAEELKVGSGGDLSKAKKAFLSKDIVPLYVNLDGKKVADNGNADVVTIPASVKGHDNKIPATKHKVEIYIGLNGGGAVQTDTGKALTNAQVKQLSDLKDVKIDAMTTKMEPIVKPA